MAAAKHPPLPMILAANDLLEGSTVYHAGDRWLPSFSDALVARDEPDALRLEAALMNSEIKGDVVEPYLMAVSFDQKGRIIPRHYRERIRALGPTVRQDLGPQARGEHSHVSV